MSRDNWTDAQNDALVADYFRMFSEQLSGRNANKAAHNRQLQALTGRRRTGIEFKHRNVSAILHGLGSDFLTGYLPAMNFQSSLEDAVSRWLQDHPGWLERASSPSVGMAHQQGYGDAILPLSPPPTMANQPPAKEVEKMMGVARRFDAAGRDARNRELGRAGEERALAHERASLIREGRRDLADRIRWISQEVGDGAGYDIHSFEPGGQDRLIEVKTTNGWERTPFHISRHEVAFGEAHPREWLVLRLWSFSRDAKAFELRPPLSNHVSLMPTSFEASFH